MIGGFLPMRGFHPARVIVFVLPKAGRLRQWMQAEPPVSHMVFAALALHASTAFPLASICFASASVVLNQNLYHSPVTSLVL